MRLGRNETWSYVCSCERLRHEQLLGRVLMATSCLQKHLFRWLLRACSSDATDEMSGPDRVGWWTGSRRRGWLWVGKTSSIVEWRADAKLADGSNRHICLCPDTDWTMWNSKGKNLPVPSAHKQNAEVMKRSCDWHTHCKETCWVCVVKRKEWGQQSLSPSKPGLTSLPQAGVRAPA